MAASVLIICIVLLGVSGTWGAPSKQGDSRIFGGEDAVQGQFPGIVSLRSSADFDTHVCGGTIIAPDLILTAGHCVVSLQSGPIEIVAGSVLRHNGTRVAVSKTALHKEYSDDTKHNDIGLLLLSTPLNYTEDIQPVELADNNTISAGDNATTIGWGFSDKNPEDLPEVLQWLEGTIPSNEECNEIYSQFGATIINSQICFGGGEMLVGNCFGDSGSPLLFNNKTVGIVSYGLSFGFCAIGSPDVYTRVSSYIDWINDTADTLRQDA